MGRKQSYRNAHTVKILSEISYNWMIIVLLYTAYWLKLSNVIIYSLILLLTMVLSINFFVLAPGIENRFCVIKQDDKQNPLLCFFKYWIFWRIIYVFLTLNTMEFIYRYITYRFRSYPDFYCLGPIKTGSTTLSMHLQTIGFHGPFTYWNHPPIGGKESEFFSGILGSSKSHHSLYKLHFPLLIMKKLWRYLCGKNTLYFDADPTYFAWPHVRDRIYAATPNAKFIVTVRDPIIRSISDYKHKTRNCALARKVWGAEINPFWDNNMAKMINMAQQNSFKNQLKQLENLRINENLPETVNLVPLFSIIESSLYGKYLKFWMKRFDRNQFYIVDLYDLSNDLHGEIKKICKFIGYPITQKELEKIKPFIANNSETETQIEYQKLYQVDKTTKQFEELVDIIRKDKQDFIQISGKNVDHWT